MWTLERKQSKKKKFDEVEQPIKGGIWDDGIHWLFPSCKWRSLHFHQFH
jgi:hypothetical protein